MVRRARQMPLPTVTTETRIDSRYNPTVWYDIMYIDPKTGEAKEMVGVGFADNNSPFLMLQKMGIPYEQAVVTVSKKKR